MLKIGACVSVAVLALSLSAQAQVPRTAAGHPDLTGVWTNASLTGLTRPAGVTSLVVDEATAKKMVEHPVVAGVTKTADDAATSIDPAKLDKPPEKGGKDFGSKGYDFLWVTPGDRLAIVNGEYRTSYIVDPPNGQLPFTPEQLAKRRAMMAGAAKYLTGEGPFDGPEDAALSERCLVGFGGSGGPGMLNPIYNNNYQFVLTGDYLMVLVEMAHDVRNIPIFASAETARANHRPDAIQPWFGDSVAWWEGDTLVIETTHLNPKQTQTGFPLTSTGVVTERLTRTSEKDIAYSFAVNDPKIYSQPWKAELGFYPASRVFEYACHEGNHGLTGMLEGARERERQEAAAKQVKVAPGRH